MYINYQRLAVMLLKKPNGRHPIEVDHSQPRTDDVRHGKSNWLARTIRTLQSSSPWAAIFTVPMQATNQSVSAGNRTQHFHHTKQVHCLSENSGHIVNKGIRDSKCCNFCYGFTLRFMFCCLHVFFYVFLSPLQRLSIYVLLIIQKSW